MTTIPRGKGVAPLVGQQVERRRMLARLISQLERSTRLLQLQQAAEHDPGPAELWIELGFVVGAKLRKRLASPAVLKTKQYQRLRDLALFVLEAIDQLGVSTSPQDGAS